MNYTGRTIGNYSLNRFIGNGHFADVYLGYHKYLGTAAAIKILTTSSARDGGMDTFLNEAQTVAQLQHRHIVRVFDFGIDAQTNAPYFVMDYAPYGSLRQLHPRGSVLPLPAIVSYAKQIGSALQYAHDLKLVHRDVKPENILLGKQNELLLSDFGVVAVAHATASIETLDPAGTPLYMAPELFEGKPRPASDQYALAAMIYEWLCGHPPFQGDIYQLMNQHMHIDPPRLRTTIPSISSSVEECILQALMKDPHHRFASIQSFMHAFEVACFPPLPPFSRSIPSAPISENQSVSISGQIEQEVKRYTVIDLGTTEARAAIVENREGKIEILGSGFCMQRVGSMDGGEVCDIQGVIQTCNAALLQAEKRANGVIAPNTVIVISSGNILIVSCAMQIRREHFLRMITAEEIEVIMHSAVKKALEQAYEKVSAGGLYKNRELRLIQFHFCNIKADEQKVTNLVGFRAHQLSFTFYATFAPSKFLEAIATIAQGLDLTLLATPATVCDSASYLFHYKDEKDQTLLIDIGGGTTKIARIQGGAVTDLQNINFGGERFTQAISLQEGITLEEAEKIKRAVKRVYSMQKLIQKLCSQWIVQVKQHLAILAKQERIPSMIVVMGGGAKLPDLRTAIEKFSWEEHLPFLHSPQFHFVEPKEKDVVLDPKQYLADQQDIALIASAYEVLFLEEESPMQSALEHAVEYYHL